MRSILVVFGFPPLQFSSKVSFMLEVPALIELPRICLVAPLYLAIHFGASRRYVAMRDAEVGKMPGELWSEGRVVIGLDFLDGEGERLSNFPQEVDGRLGVVMVVDAKDPEPGRFINGCELIKALASPADARNELHIELYRAAWNRKRSIGRLRAWAIFLQRDSANVVPMKDFQNSCW